MHNRPIQEGYSPVQAFENALHSWWLVVLLVIWGGFVGWLIHLAEPPIYQAEADIQISLDFKQTGKLTQFDSDHAYETVGSVIQSPSVIDLVIKNAQGQGINITRDDFKRSAFKERREYLFALQVRRGNPQEAMALANIWAETANQVLTDAYHHAITAHQLETYLATLETCLTSPAVPPSPGYCGGLDPQALQAQIKDVSAEVGKEKDAALTLNPAISFNLSSAASLPDRPAVLGTNSLVLAGGMIGFLLAVWIVQVQLPVRLARRLKHA
jgi:capsular polysaccharide biosynthesis protein